MMEIRAGDAHRLPGLGRVVVVSARAQQRDGAWRDPLHGFLLTGDIVQCRQRHLVWTLPRWVFERAVQGAQATSER